MMTRKDYQAYIDILARTYRDLSHHFDDMEMVTATLLAEHVAYASAEVFKTDNSRFSYSRFADALEAAGLPVDARFAGKA